MDGIVLSAITDLPRADGITPSVDVRRNNDNRDNRTALIAVGGVLEIKIVLPTLNGVMGANHRRRCRRVHGLTGNIVSKRKMCTVA